MTAAQPPSENSSAQDQVRQQVRQIEARITDVIKLLHSQMEQMNQRGVNLPSTSLDDLRRLKKQFEVINHSALDSMVELRSLRALAETSALINSSQDPDQVLNQVMDTVIALTGAERGYIVLKNPDTGKLEFRVARGMDQEQLSASGMVISRSIVNRVSDTGEPVLTDNASQDERYRDQASIAMHNLRSILAVPLKVSGEVIGVAYCDNSVMSGLFKEAELRTLTAFANQAGVAIENSRLFEQARLSVQEISRMRDQMDNLFTSIAAGVLATDNEGFIIVHNAAAENILGRGEMIGFSLGEVLPPMPPIFATALDQVQLQSVQEKLAFEVEVPGRGQRSWTSILSPLRNEAGEPVGIALVLDDVTEQRERERQLAELKRYLPVALVENIGSIDEVDVVGQEREITAMFADVRGFTKFSERLEPEALMTVINKYLSLASDAINFLEGIVDKYMGDAVTGLFNTQLNPQPDHPLRAVQAAYQLIQDLHAQHEVMPEDERLYYGIGIHSGPAVLGNIGGAGRMEFGALGEATEICKVLQEQAERGEIIISETTYQAVKDDFICEPAEMRRPKKGYEDLACYRVVRRKKGARTSQLFVDQELLDMLNTLDLDEQK